MALKHRDGKYLKVIRELTEFRPSGVTVYYYEFSSDKDRDDFFKRQAEIREFLAQGDLKFHEIDAEATRLLYESGIDMSTVTSYEELPSEIRKMVKDGEEMLTELDIVSKGWDKPEPLPKFKHQKLLDEFGFKKEWRTPLSAWGINSIMTGSFTNQTFSYDCLYGELKKIFKNDFIDC